MTSALEACAKPLVDDHLCQFASNDACTKREDVGVVVHSGKLCCVRLAADACADAFYLVCCQGDTNACSADSDSEVCLAVSDSTADFLTIYRIVTALCGVGSEV